MDSLESKPPFMQILRGKTIEEYRAETTRRRLGHRSEQSGVNSERRSAHGQSDNVSKAKRVLQMLRRAEKRWVEITEFRDAGIFDFRNPIAELRHRGFGIANWMQRDQHRRVESYYRLTFDLERDRLERDRP